MTLYAYVCDDHGAFDSQTRSDRVPCPVCGEEGRRRFAVTMAAMVHSHYNPAFGCEVTSTRHARELTKIAAEEQANRLGMDTHYELCDAHDNLPRDGKSEREFEAAYTKALTQGLPTPKRDPGK